MSQKSFLYKSFTQTVIKTKFVNDYIAYVRMKNKMIKMQRNSLYTLTKEWFGDSIWKTKQVSLKKTKLKFSVIVVKKHLTSVLINKFPV